MWVLDIEGGYPAMYNPELSTEDVLTLAAAVGAVLLLCSAYFYILNKIVFCSALESTFFALGGS